MSTNFGPVDLDHLPFPVHMRVDYVRVYQPKDKKNIGCDPKDFPTAEYINTYVFRVSSTCSLISLENHRYIEAYTNPNLTTWTNDYDQPFPKNRFLGQC